MRQSLFASGMLLAAVAASPEIARAAQFKVNNDQYDRLLDVMESKGIMPPHKTACKTDGSDYLCTIRADGMAIITYAPSSSENITTITFVATAKTLDRVSSLAAMASLSLNRKFVRMTDMSNGASMVEREKTSIERTMMGIILRGGTPDMELIAGGERFYYEADPGQAVVRVVAKD